MTTASLQEFVAPSRYIDSDADNVVAFARRVAGAARDATAAAVAL